MVQRKVLGQLSVSSSSISSASLGHLPSPQPAAPCILDWAGVVLKARPSRGCFLQGCCVQIEKKRSGGFYYEDLQPGVIFHGNPLQGIYGLQLQRLVVPRKTTGWRPHSRRVSLRGTNAIDNEYHCSLRENTKANKQTSKEFSCLCPPPPLCKSHS